MGDVVEINSDRLKGAQPLSIRQKELLIFVGQYFAEYGYYPTTREMSAALKLNTPSPMGYLRPLQDKGYMLKTSDSRRKWQLTEAGADMLLTLGVDIDEGSDQQELFN